MFVYMSVSVSVFVYMSGYACLTGCVAVCLCLCVRGGCEPIDYKGLSIIVGINWQNGWVLTGKRGAY